MKKIEILNNFLQNQDKNCDKLVKRVVADFSANVNTVMHHFNYVIMPREVEIV